MKKKRNPLSYLGWLGFIGFFGVVWWTPGVAVLLLFFFFFGYANMPTDELFWQNVRRASLRAFAVSMATGTLFMVSWFLTNLWIIFNGQTGSQPMEIVDGTVTISETTFFLFVYLGAFFILTLVASLSVFVFTLWRIDRKERKFLEDEPC